MTEESVSASRSGGTKIARYLPAAVLILGFVAFFVVDHFFFHISRYLTFDSLKAHRAALTGWVADHGVLAGLGFVAMYAVTVAFSLPGGTLLSITGGFLFGWALGSVYIVIGATTGATVVFLAAKTALGDVLRAKAGPTLKKVETGFRKDAFSYLLVLRLIPLFPFFIVNLVPAFLGVPLVTYFWATLIGIVPGVVVYSSVGNGLGAVLDRGGTPEIGILFEPAVLAPLIGLALLALAPVLYKAIKKPG